MSGKEANKAKPATFIYGRKLAKLYEDCALGSEALPGSSGHIPLLLYDAGSWMGMALVRRPRVVDTYPCYCDTALHFPATTNPPDRRSDPPQRIDAGDKRTRARASGVTVVAIAARAGWVRGAPPRPPIPGSARRCGSRPRAAAPPAASGRGRSASPCAWAAPSPAGAREGGAACGARGACGSAAGTRRGRTASTWPGCSSSGTTTETVRPAAADTARPRERRQGGAQAPTATTLGVPGAHPAPCARRSCRRACSPRGW